MASVNLMRADKQLISGLFFLLLAAHAGNLLAVDIYQWTDADGVIHFSQWSPGDDVPGVAAISLEGVEQSDNGIGVSEADDPEGYAAHRQEMDAMRAEMAARREAERERRDDRSGSPVVYVVEQPTYAYPWLPRFERPRPPHHRPSRPQPRPGDAAGQPVASLPFKRP